MKLGSDPLRKSPQFGCLFSFKRVLILIICSYIVKSTGVRITSLKIPSVADPRNILELNCHFDMGNEELYAVKWYKDDQEFFRYMPQQDRQTILFPVFGVKVDLQNSNCDRTHCKVILEKLSRRYSGGSYRCEISSEAPSFRLASETQNVTIAALPKEKPKIQGLAAYYKEGDIVSADCTSDFGDPVPLLRWYVDGEPTLPVSKPTFLERESDSLIAQSILLNLVVTNISRGSLEIGCEAFLSGIPFTPQITSTVVLLRPQHADDETNKEKLQLWYSPFYSTATLSTLSYHLILLIVFIFIIRYL